MIDLHGFTIHEAWLLFTEEVDEAYWAEQKSITVVTGQGMMMREFETWARNHPRIREVIQHKHNPGSWSVKLKKVRKK